MSIREEPKKPVEISPAKVQRNAILKHYKVPKFDGESSWDLYIRQFEVAAMANGWTEHQKATELALAHQGKALGILQNIPETKQGDYYSLTKVLKLTFDAGVPKPTEK